MLNWVRGEKLLAVVHFIYFLRILQQISNILLPSRQNWTTEVWLFLQKPDNWWKYLSQLVLTSYFILVCLNENNCLLLTLFLNGWLSLLYSVSILRLLPNLKYPEWISNKYVNLIQQTNLAKTDLSRSFFICYGNISMHGTVFLYQTQYKNN